MTTGTASTNGETAWFALTVKPRHEKATALQLDRKGLESYLPLYRSKRRWSDRFKEVELCLFPGYVFCRFGFERRLDVLNVSSVHSIVGFGSYLTLLGRIGAQKAGYTMVTFPVVALAISFTNA